jgi:hypothetical protein
LAAAAFWSKTGSRGGSAFLSKASWSWGCVSAIDFIGRTIWITDAHRSDGKRFIVRADEKLTALWNWKRRFARTASVDLTFFRASIHLDKLARLFAESL